MMSIRDLENAKEIGELVSDVKYIRETMDMMREDTKLKRKEIDARLCQLELYQNNQKAYFAMFMFIGGLVVGFVDFLVRNIDSLKK